MDSLGKAVFGHPTLRYIDISGNQIGTLGFLNFYNKVNRMASSLQVLRSRSNDIGGFLIGMSFKGISKCL